MTAEFLFRIEATDGGARLGRLRTAHGEIQTPTFMPVGTLGTVKGMTSQALRDSGAQIVLANAYHLMLRPGSERIARLGGLRKFMNWRGPVLTDSGGYQVMSLGGLRAIDDDGVTFRSHIDGSEHRLTPERAMAVQHELDSTVTMVLDDCTPYPVPQGEAAASMRRSMAWARRCRDAFRPRPGYGLFGIVQGSVFPELRAESSDALRAIEFDGYAIGGLAVGEGQQATFEAMEATLPELPGDAPRYAMGIGRPDDIVGAVQRGIDMFDCVLPTRSGRTGQAFTPRGTLNLRNARHADDPRPLVDDCGCPACRGHARAYLHHLVKNGEILGSVLLTWHNLHYYQVLMDELRGAISENRLTSFADGFARDWMSGDIDPPS